MSEASLIGKLLKISKVHKTINNYCAYSANTNEINIMVFLHNFVYSNVETLSGHTKRQCKLYAA